MRPEYLNEIAAGAAAFVIIGCAWVGQGSMSLASALVLAVPFVGLVLAVYWYLSRGKNWARVISIALALLAISAIRSPFVDLVQEVVAYLHAGYSAFLIWWLLRPSVRSYFRANRAAA